MRFIITLLIFAMGVPAFGMSALCKDWLSMSPGRLNVGKSVGYVQGGQRKSLFIDQLGYNVFFVSEPSMSPYGNACKAQITDPQGKVILSNIDIILDSPTKLAFTDYSAAHDMNRLTSALNAGNMLNQPMPCPSNYEQPRDLSPLLSLLETQNSEEERLYKDLDERNKDHIQKYDQNTNGVNPYDGSSDDFYEPTLMSDSDIEGNYFESNGELEGSSPYSIYEQKRSELLSLGKEACLSEKTKLAEEMIQKSSWGKVPEEERSKHVYNEAKAIFNDLQNKGVRFRSHVSPRLATCIAMYELRGNLNPFVINYTYCNEKMTSTAVGFGQITRTTLNDALDQPGEFPLLTEEAQKLQGITNHRERHRIVSANPRLQIEAILHVLNMKSRYAGSGASLEDVIHRYDQDGASAYVKTVSKCVKSGGEPEL